MSSLSKSLTATHCNPSPEPEPNLPHIAPHALLVGVELAKFGADTTLRAGLELGLVRWRCFGRLGLGITSEMSEMWYYSR